jgi:zinc protease
MAMSPSRTVLANGLSVLVAPSDRVPLVALRLEYAGGVSDGAPGAAELALRSVIAGTAHVRDGAYYANLGRLGATETTDVVRATTTVLAVTVPREAVDTVLWMWSDQMAFGGAGMTDAQIDRQRTLALNNWQVAFGSVPLGCVGDLVREAVHPGPHSAVPPIVPPPAALAAVSARDVRAFYDGHYAPNGSVLSIVGDVDEPTLLASVRRYFGDIPATRSSATLADSPATARLSGVKTLDAVSSSPVTEVVLAWPTVAYLQADDAELDVIAAILQGKNAALLGWSLIDDKKLATYVDAHQTSNARGSMFAIRVFAPAGTDPDALVAAVDGVLRGLDEREIDHWLKGAVAGLMERELLASEHAAHRAYRIGDYDRVAHDPSYGKTLQRRQWTMTASAVEAAMRRQLPPDRRVVMRVTHSDAAPSCGAVAPVRAGAPVIR